MEMDINERLQSCHAIYSYCQKMPKTYFSSKNDFIYVMTTIIRFSDLFKK